MSVCLSIGSEKTYSPQNSTEQLNIMMQRTANENAACLRGICKKSDQPKIERLVNNDARLILRRKLNRQRHDRIQTESQIATADSCFRPCWVSSARCSKLWVFSWSTDIHKPTVCNTIFSIFPIVPSHAFCMWHWPIGKDSDLSFIWGHHHLHIYIATIAETWEDWERVWLFLI